MDSQSAYRANQPYRYEYAEDSRSCIVPPPDTVQSDRKCVLRLPSNGDLGLIQHNLYGNPDFIAALARNYDLRTECTVSSWTYSDRHKAQEILPFMLLGPMSFARDADEVRKAGITMMIAVRSKRIAEARPAMMDPGRFEAAQGLETATFDVDSPFDMVTRRSHVIKRINDHLEGSVAGQSQEDAKGLSRKVLVFCETGNERSPILPALYLMTIWGLDAFNAVQVVQARRFGIGLNPEMIAMLQDVQQILVAERQVAAARRSPSVPPTTSRKRNIDQAYELEEEGEAWYAGGDKADVRMGIAPFADGSV